MLLLGIVIGLALLSLITVVQRIHHVYKQTRPGSADAESETIPALADSLKKGSRRE
jgi:hypothetical protein